MERFKIHTPETAPAPADATLRALHDMLGFVPNVFAVMAETPAVLSAFVTLNQKFAETSLTATEREVLQMAVSSENNGGYCVAGHTAFAVAQNVPENAITAVRGKQALADAKLDALASFARAMVAKKGRISAAELEGFLAAGYEIDQAHEVILGICVKTFSNLTSSLLGIPLDDPFRPYAWQPSKASQAA